MPLGIIFFRRILRGCFKSYVLKQPLISFFACKITDVCINTQYLLIGITCDVSTCLLQCFYACCQNKKTDKGNVVGFPLPVFFIFVLKNLCPPCYSDVHVRLFVVYRSVRIAIFAEGITVVAMYPDVLVF